MSTKHEERRQLPEEQPPRPTYVPAGAALGIMLGLWGILTMWIMSVVGIALFVWAIAAWVHEIRFAWKSQ